MPVVLLGLAAAAPVVSADPAITRLFPDAMAAPQIQPGKVTVRYGPKKLPITLIPVRFEPRPERAETSHLWCGLALREGGSLKTGIVTVGTGYTELLSCHRFVAAGAVPSDLGKPRIGLIYETVARVDVDTTPIVIVQGSGKWTVDEVATRKLDNGRVSVRTIADMRRVLAR